MKTITKISISLLMLISASAVKKANAQICTFTGEECCGEGITHFQLNGTPAINRNSTVTENGGFTNTGLTTTVVKGMMYNYSVTFPIENNIVNCNTFNLKIYIDYNQNNSLTDAGEEVATLDNVPNGTYYGNFTIPITALIGNAYMRVMMKMAATSLSGGFCGHTPITPCNIPVDAVGYHGEVENYTLTIAASTGIADYFSGSSSILVYPNPTDGKLTIEKENENTVTLEVFNIVGEKVFQQEIKNSKTELNLIIPDGIYSITLQNDKMFESKLFIKK